MIKQAVGMVLIFFCYTTVFTGSNDTDIVEKIAQEYNAPEVHINNQSMVHRFCEFLAEEDSDALFWGTFAAVMGIVLLCTQDDTAH